MAIKISNTTVIDDSRNITNINDAIITGTITPSKVKISGNTLYNTLERVTGNNIGGWYYTRKSFSIAGQELTASSLFFRPDGTRFYIVGTTNDTVYQYNLTTPWDIATASFTAGQSFSIAAQEGTPTGVFFRDNGTKMYILGTTNDTVYQYTLSTAWNITTATYDNVSFSVTAQDGTPTGLFFRPNGLEFYISGDASNAVYKYTLTTAWDVSTASYSGTSFAIGTQEALPQDIWFTSDGLKFYITGQNRRGITEYTLTTEWNITTATVSGYFSINNFESTPTGLYFSEAENLIFILGSGNDNIYEISSNAESTYVDVNKFYVRSDAEFMSGLVANSTIVGEAIRSIGNMNVGAALNVNSIAASSITSATTLFDTLTTGAFTALSGMTAGTASIGGTAQTGTLTLGRSTAAQTVGIATGATTTGNTKTVNIATNGATGSTTNVNIGASATGTSIDLLVGATGQLKISRETAQYLQLTSLTDGNVVRGVSSSAAAKPIIFDSTTDLANTAPTNGTNGYIFRILGTDAVTINNLGNVTFNTGTSFGTPPTTASVSLFNSPTTVTAFTAATTLSLGANAGTATIINPTVTLSNATTLNINGTSPTLASTSTGTLTLFNTNIGTVNAFGAASSITLGNQSTTGSSTFTISGASNTIGSKSILIGANGASGSSTSVSIGTSAGGTSTTTINGALTVTPATADVVVIGSTAGTGSITIGQSTASQTINIANGSISAGANSTVTIGNGVTNSGGNRTVQIATGGTSGSTTSVSIGSTAGTSTTTLNGAVNATGDLTVTGNLTVNGTTTTVNSTTVTVDDKNIELGSVATPTDTTADGGGITLKGTTDKSIIWDSANTNWTLSEHINIPTGKVFKINNTQVLSSTALGTGVTSSSLTSVGTLTSLSVTGAITANTTTNNQSYTTTGAGTITISSGTTGSISNMNISGGTASFTGQITSTVATGTAPFSVTSTTPVANLSIGGNANTATTLQTARTINGTSFNGSANITVPTNNTADTTSTASHFVTFSASSATGNNGTKVSTGLTFQPSTGNFTASGNITAFSDERLKTDWADFGAHFIAKLADVKSGSYTRIDTGERQVGVSAQSLSTVIPDAVMCNGLDDMLSVSYGQAALVACIELAKEVTELRRIIDKLIGNYYAN